MSVTATPHPTYSWLSVFTKTCPRGHEMRKTGPAGGQVTFPLCRPCDALESRAKRKRAAEETPEAREARRQTRDANARRRRFGTNGEPEIEPWMEPIFAAVLLEHRVSLDDIIGHDRQVRFVAARRDLAKRLFAGGATMTKIGRAIRRDWASCRHLVHGVKR